MAYAEKRGKASWRVRYQRPDGTWASESGFPTKTTALARGRELEADANRGVYVDPRKGQTPLADWATVWMAAQRVSGRTLETRHRLLDRHVLPKWGRVQVAAINWFEVRAWADQLDCAPTTADHSVTLMSMMLTGAVDAGMIPVNPLHQRRRRSHKAPKTEKTWAQPDEALAMSERPASPADRLMILTAAWTGMRWGELCGLHRDNCGLLRRDRDGGTLYVRRVIRIDPDAGALHEVDERQEDGSKVHRLFLGPPKPPNGAREIDLPPFLAAMLDKHMATWPHPYLFVGTDGGWHRRNNFNARVMGPVADGREGKPRTRGRAEVPAWEPIRSGQRMHGLRHANKTWMIEDGVPEVLQCEQLGHELGGIRGIYSHVSPAMRQRRIDALQARWERAAAESREAV